MEHAADNRRDETFRQRDDIATRTVDFVREAQRDRLPGDGTAAGPAVAGRGGAGAGPRRRGDPTRSTVKRNA